MHQVHNFDGFVYIFMVSDVQIVSCLLLYILITQLLICKKYTTYFPEMINIYLLLFQFELLYFASSCSWMSIESQYRWYQTIYQVGVFLSRSSIICFKFKILWLLPFLQVILCTAIIAMICYSMIVFLELLAPIDNDECIKSNEYNHLFNYC